MSDKRKTVSINDVARASGVSIGTVDRVLHKRGRVSAKTEARIRQVIEALDYRPNIYARNLSLAKVFQFAVLMPMLAQDSDYWRIPSRGIDKAVHELEPYKVRVKYFFFDRYSNSSFEKSFRKMASGRVDGLLIAPVLSQAAKEMLSTLGGKLPFAFFDCAIPGAGCISSVVQDPFQSGLLAAHLMRKTLTKPGSLAVVKVVPEDFHINERIRGFQKGMDHGFGISSRLYEVDSHKVGEFQRIAEKIVIENKDLRGVFVSNAWTHPLARYLKSEDRLKGVIIIGYDLVAKNIRSLVDEKIDFLISQRPEMQGYEGIYCLYDHLVMRASVRRKIMVPIDIITKDNLKYYQD